MVAQFVLRVRWVRASKDTSGGVDTHDDDRIVDVIERMHADTVATLEAMVLEAGNELANEVSCLVPGDVTGWVERIDKYRSVGVEGTVVKDPRCEIFGWELDMLGGFEGHVGFGDLCNDDVFRGND